MLKPKLLIAVKSCQADKEKGYHNAIRATWGKEIPPDITLRFFMGDIFSPTQPDEVHLDCKDDYLSLPFKTKEICRWFHDRLFTHIFLCDVDTFIFPKFYQTDYAPYDYAGFFCSKNLTTQNMHNDTYFNIHGLSWTWASGGLGYFLSKKAADIIYDATPTFIAEDYWVGQELTPLAALGELKARELGDFGTFHFSCKHHRGIMTPWMIEQLYVMKDLKKFQDVYHI